MIEIKFRAWSNSAKIMSSWENIIADEYMKDFFLLKFMTNPPTPVCELMQYTGLKDKQRKEIYEGGYN